MMPKNYSIIVGYNNTFKTFHVRAPSKKEAIDKLANYVVSEDWKEFYFTAEELATHCAVGQTVAELAKRKNLISCGSKGYYMQIISVTEEGI